MSFSGLFIEIFRDFHTTVEEQELKKYSNWNNQKEEKQLNGDVTLTDIYDGNKKFMTIQDPRPLSWNF